MHVLPQLFFMVFVTLQRGYYAARNLWGLAFFTHYCQDSPLLLQASVEVARLGCCLHSLVRTVRV